MRQFQREFFRPTWIACLGFALAVGVMEVLVRQTAPPDALSGVPSVDQLQQPSPDLTPEDVVRIQLRSLASASGMGMVECFSFASPANRVQTGPVERFAKMVRQPPYDVLSLAHASVVGNAVYREETARVLVTMIHQHRVHTFVWVLSRQKDDPYVGCWMCDAVLPVIRRGGPEPNDPNPAADSPSSPTI